MEKTIKIAITGPESVGKSMLAFSLSKHFNAPFVKEYARSYLKNKGANYTFSDIVAIAQKHIELERNIVKQKHPLVFFDTDVINFKIWFEYFGYKTPDFLEKRIKEEPYSHSLLLYPNTKWVADGIRQNKDNRVEIYQKFDFLLSKNKYNKK